jgi:MFS-type transporter involved in bile tolerance (Atg22 family)
MAPTTGQSAHRAAMRRSIIRSTATVVVLVAAFAFLPLRGDHWWVGAVLGAVLLATVVPLAVSRLRRVLTSDRPGFEAAEALVQLVAMLITGFAAVLYAMNRNGTQLSGLDTRVDAVYFTVTVLSTVGFGDIHATSQAARLVVTIQILFDLAFLGVFVRIFLGAAKLRVDEKLTPGPDAD